MHTIIPISLLAVSLLNLNHRAIGFAPIIPMRSRTTQHHAIVIVSPLHELKTDLQERSSTANDTPNKLMDPLLD
eukprot:CAMPEP_0172324752 /NCGR_PEP_ID=MMETSP1058-20130122/52191_1 /TAXON_ID=83371 /ORGANISM="Detonula confervacea, Strain CCMP 353" /LENGTH=73 /DNA_ID=CAMNT_0013041117 /DNA_START=100 /DNA_END=318 /DNA_ORIENTATION=-